MGQDSEAAAEFVATVRTEHQGTFMVWSAMLPHFLCSLLVLPHSNIVSLLDYSLPLYPDLSYLALFCQP
jgi:hypothetical protein